MGMYVCKPCLVEHDLRSEATEKIGALNLIMACLDGADTLACCEICGPVRDDWAEKSVYWTDRITRDVGTPDRRAHVLAELAAYKAWKAGGCVGKY